MYSTIIREVPDLGYIAFRVLTNGDKRTLLLNRSVYYVKPHVTGNVWVTTGKVIKPTARKHTILAAFQSRIAAEVTPAQARKA
tara:strand:+ start:375 stop:623 length:249 start_codon:yes stop_codon:yes gene_type:complete